MQHQTHTNNKNQNQQNNKTTKPKAKTHKLLTTTTLNQTAINQTQMCGTIRHNQDEPQWIVAQRLLSALTIPEVFKSSAKELSLSPRTYN